MSSACMLSANVSANTFLKIAHAFALRTAGRKENLVNIRGFVPARLAHDDAPPGSSHSSTEPGPRRKRFRTSEGTEIWP